MHLPVLGPREGTPFEEKGLGKRILGQVVDTLLNPVCKTLPGVPGCSDSDPPPTPPAPVPTPTPTATPPASTHKPENDPPPPQDTSKPDTPNPPTEKPPPGAGSDSGDSGSNGGSSGSGSGSGSSNSGTDVGSGSGTGAGTGTGNSGSSGSGAGGGAAGPTPTQGGSQGGGNTSGANGNGNGSGIDNHSSNAAASAEQGTSGQGGQSQPTPAVGSGSGASDNGEGAAGGTAGGTAGAGGGVNPTPVNGFAPGATGSPSFTGDNFDPDAFDGLQGGAGSEYTGGGSTVTAGGDRGGDRNGNGDNGSTANAQHPSSLGGIIGAIVAILVVLLVLAALVYRYRRTRHVQAFLRKFTPFKISPYTESEKKRSSMGAGLLFTDGLLGDALMNEKRGTMDYGTTLPPPVTHPNRAMARPERPDGPPVINTVIANNRVSTPISPHLIDVSPLSPGFPMSPPPTVAKRSSQDSLGGVSIASSGIFSPSLLSWGVPPSEAQSIMTSRPPSPHGAETAARHPPMPALSPLTPSSPSNWQRPPNWD